MSQTVEESSDVETQVDHKDHLGDWDYVKIALVLAAITAVEVFTYFESLLDWGKVLIPALLVMMVVKFWVVAAYFMHLKGDFKLFTHLFFGGLVLAVVVFSATLSAFEFWT